MSLTVPSSPPRLGEPAEPSKFEAEPRSAPVRLTVTRGALGIELYGSAELGPLEVTALSFTLPGVRFPIDLSGGVPQFRHRRGVLERLELRVSIGRLAQWIRTKLSQQSSDPDANVDVSIRPNAICIQLSDSKGALAFDLIWALRDRDACFVLANARGMPHDEPVLGQALRLLDGLLPPTFIKKGRQLVVQRLAYAICCECLPALGLRVPDCSRVQFGEIVMNGDELSLELDSQLSPAEISREAIGALELSELVSEADDAVKAGDLAQARAGYVALLEQAPRHPELARLIAAIDVSTGLPEAALGMLREAVPIESFGLVGAQLLRRIGDHEGALQAAKAAAQSELFPAMAALCWVQVSEIERDPSARKRALDMAVARAVGCKNVRWARFLERVQTDDVAGAIADAEHLEALSQGAKARHAVCLRTARAFWDVSLLEPAGKWFERALRYLPEDSEATAGLARALAAVGQKSRAMLLFQRALDLSAKRGQPDADALLDLAKLLAEHLGDLPAAIARVRQVPMAARRLTEARYWEATWRAQLGDLSGATLAYGRMRELIELDNVVDPKSAEWLKQAADFERDPLLVERHLAVALKVAPHDQDLARAYQAAARLVYESRTGGKPNPS